MPVCRKVERIPGRSRRTCRLFGLVSCVLGEQLTVPLKDSGNLGTGCSASRRQSAVDALDQSGAYRPQHGRSGEWTDLTGIRVALQIAVTFCVYALQGCIARQEGHQLIPV